MITDNFKSLMKIHGVTYADIGEQIDRSPVTVQQRLNSENTFNKHYKQYKKALDVCILNKEEEKRKALEALNEISQG